MNKTSTLLAGWLAVLAVPAHAGDPPPGLPLPTWSAGEAEGPSIADPDPTATTPRGAAATIDTTPQPLHTPAPSSHGWADVASLTASVAGRADRVTWITATARTPEMVAHWAQGPYLIADETVPPSVDLPAEVVASVQLHGHGYLSARVVETTLDGRAYPSQRLGKARLAPVDAHVAGIDRASWSTLWEESTVDPDHEATP